MTFNHVYTGSNPVGRILQVLFRFLLSWASPSGDAFILGKINGAFLRAKTPKFHYTTPPHFLSSKNLHKVSIKKFPKLVQNSLLIFKKFFDIIYIQGKGSQRSQNKKTFKKLKKFLTKQKPCDIMIMSRGDARQVVDRRHPLRKTRAKEI